MELPFRGKAALEANLRADRHAQIVVRSVVEVHLVADFSSDTEPSGIGFDTASGIENPVGVAARYAIKLTGQVVVGGEVEESTFCGHERSKRARAYLELG